MEFTFERAQAISAQLNFPHLIDVAGKRSCKEEIDEVFENLTTEETQDTRKGTRQGTRPVRHPYAGIYC